MVIKYTDEFIANNIIPANAEYPTGSAKNETKAGSSNDGTVVDAKITNDFLGMQHAILNEGNVDPSGLTETALVSDVLKALKEIFEQKLILGGNWDDIKNSSLLESDKRKYWIYDNKPYGIVPTHNSFPITAPDKPTDQPSIFYLIDDVKRFELVEDTDVSIPVGAYIDFPSGEDPKEGFLKADGRLVYKFQYPNLFDVIGRTFSLPSDSSAKFRLPKLDDVKVETEGRPAHEGQTQEVTYWDGYQFSITADDTPATFLHNVGGITSYVLGGEQYLAFIDKDFERIFIFTTTGSSVTYKMKITSSNIPNGIFESPEAIEPYVIGGEQYLAVTDYSQKKVFIFTVTSYSATYKFSITSSDITGDDFKSPRGITSYVLGGEQYLAVGDVQRIKVFIFTVTSYSATYKFSITSSDIPNDSLVYPSGIASYVLGGKQYLAVGVSYIKKVFIFTVTSYSATYKFSITSSDIPNDSLGYPSGIASYVLGGEQYLAVTDSNNHKFFIFTTTGSSVTYKMKITSNDVPNNSLVYPSGITSYVLGGEQYLAVDGNRDKVGKVFIFKYALYKIPIFYKYNFTHGSFDVPEKMTSYNLDGDQYLAVTDFNENKVFIFTTTGNSSIYQFEITSSDITDDNFDNPYGITSYKIDNSQYLAVTDNSKNKVFVFTVANNSTTYQFEITSSDITDDSFGKANYITAYVLSDKQYLAIADYNKHKVFFFSVTESSATYEFKLELSYTMAGITSYQRYNNTYLAISGAYSKKILIYLVSSSSASYKFEIASGDIPNDSFDKPTSMTSYKVGKDYYLAVTDNSKNKVFFFTVTSVNSTYEFEIDLSDIQGTSFNDPKDVISYTIDGYQYLSVLDNSYDAILTFLHDQDLPAKLPQLIYQNSRYIKY